MNDYVCITVLSKPGEDAAGFSARLSHLWTHMLRSRPADFERVYAETTAFENHGHRRGRQYLVEAGVLTVLEVELTNAGLEYEPVDAEEIYSKYEAVPPEWMQIDH